MRRIDVDGGIGLDQSRGSEIEILAIQDVSFHRGRGHIRVLPMLESQHFLEALLEEQPKDIRRGAMIFENPVIALLPDNPIDKTRDKNPEGVEEVTLKGLLRLFLDGVDCISPTSTNSSVADGNSIPELRS